ncbi:hypothetical protein Tco_0266082 [Tanacetum coccineum]
MKITRFSKNLMRTFYEALDRFNSFKGMPSSWVFKLHQLNTFYALTSLIQDSLNAAAVHNFLRQNASRMFKKSREQVFSHALIDDLVKVRDYPSLLAKDAIYLQSGTKLQDTQLLQPNDCKPTNRPEGRHPASKSNLKSVNHHHPHPNQEQNLPGVRKELNSVKKQPLISSVDEPPRLNSRNCHRTILNTHF